MRQHVVVLMGGWSRERPISFKTGEACATALEAEGFHVSRIDVDRNIAETLVNLKPDIAFNALTGPGGEDGSIQGLLEILQIPYTHSGVLASALAMDKPRAKKIFSTAGIRCPSGLVASPAEAATRHLLPLPYIMKPTNEGSTLGVYLIKEEGTQDLKEIDFDFGKEVMLEEYIPGRELSVAVLNGEPLGTVEIISAKTLYDFEAKYDPGKSEHIVPAPVDSDVERAALEMAVKAHKTIGCRGITRSDIRYDSSQGVDGLYLLELNTQPGMTNTSLVPDIARRANINMQQLVRALVADAGLLK